MSKLFERSGVAFQYPENWTLETDDAGGGWTVLLQSPETAFMLVSFRPDADGPGQVIGEALATLRAEYPTLDAEAAVDTLADMPAVGHDIDFITVDTPVFCWVRCVDTESGPLMVLCQTSEFDRPKNEPVLRAICTSMVIADGE